MFILYQVKNTLQASQKIQILVNVFPNILPDEFKDEIVKIETEPEHEILKVIPASFEIRYEDFVLVPASKKHIYEPAEYTTRIDTLWVKDSYNELSVIPASFSSNTEEIEVKPAIGNWVAGDKDPECPSINPTDCRVFHYVENPAVIRTIPKRKLTSGLNTIKNKITGQYKLIERKVETKAARTREVLISAITKQYEKKVLVKDESTESITVPAKFVEVVKKVMIKKGGTTAWREIPCNIPEKGKILPIHYALGSAVLTNDSKRIIDKHILSLLKSDSTTIVEVGSHTDARGDDNLNQKLSERRAKSVVDYLISRGVASSRLIAVGYGETKLLNDCKDGVECSERKHQQNRQTEFKAFFL